MYLQLIFFCLFILTILNLQNNRSALLRNRILTISFVLLFFILSFIRWERGTDWLTYYDFFTNTDSYGAGSFDFGFLWLNIIVKSISPNYTLMLFVQALFIYLVIYKITIRYKYSLLVLYLMFIPYSYGGIFFVRQTLAMTLILYSYNFLKNKSLYSFVLLILLASLFHKASFSFLFAIVLFLDLSWRNILSFVLLILGIIFLFTQIDYLDSFINKIDIYSSAPIYANDLSFEQEYFNGVLFRCTYVFIFGFFYNRINSDYKNLFHIYLIGFILYSVLGSINITLARLSLYFDQFQILLIYFIIVSQKGVKRYAFFILFSIILFIRILFPGNYIDLFVPYKSIFNKELNVKVY